MIELNDNPETLLGASHLDRFLLNGREIILKETGVFDSTEVYLTAADSPGFICPGLSDRLRESEDCDNPRYDSVWWHLRPFGSGSAVHTRERMLHIIKSGEYTIG